MDYYFLPDANKKKYNGPIPSDRDAFIQMAKGLDYIHSEGLVHRDVKPGNVLISTTDKYVLLKWSDFGLSKPDSHVSLIKPSSSGINRYLLYIYFALV